MLFLSSCASAPLPPPVTAFDAKWEYLQSLSTPAVTKACISEEDLGVFREIIIQCQIYNQGQH